MKLYHISQPEECDYDTFSDAVVCAPDEQAARLTHPGVGELWPPESWIKGRLSTWCDSPDQVIVKYIGEAAAGLEPGVICASFNAG